MSTCTEPSCVISCAQCLLDPGREFQICLRETHAKLKPAFQTFSHDAPQEEPLKLATNL